MENLDPLKISYVVVQRDDRLDDTSPFQGFGDSWPSTLWALRFLSVAPASIIERRMPLDGLIAQRMGGMHRLRWLPLWIGALEQLSVDQIGFVTVVCSGDDGVARRVDDWRAMQARPVLHIKGGDIQSDEEAVELCDTLLREHCRRLVSEHGQTLSQPRLDAARLGIEEWLSRKRVQDTEAPGGHNVTLPNQMALLRADRNLKIQEPFIGETEDAYDDLAVASATSVLELRKSNGFRDFNRMYLPQAGLVLAEPAFYRWTYGRQRGNPSFTTKPMLDALRRLQTQTGLCNAIDGEAVEAFLADQKAQALVAIRQSELETQAYGVGLMAAQTCSAVLRLRPAVNHVFPTLSRYARNIRADSQAARLKTPRLFLDIQNELAEAIGQDRIDFINGYKGSIKIVSDAPIELLPIGNIPLSLRYDCSRINATPGNLMMAELVGPSPVTLRPDELGNIVVISAFRDNDPLRELLERGLDVMSPALENRVRISFVRVKSRAELVSALNESDATILIFDGHGVSTDKDGIGGIDVNGEKVNVWELRGEARIPPIVILSACDTHELDATTHVTVGNGFLAAGARTVLATILPIDGVEGAVFINRLALRLAQYIPAALAPKHRVISWCEIVSGMTRMVLGTDLVNGMVKNSDTAISLKKRANTHINFDNPNWYDAIISDIAEEIGKDLPYTYSRGHGIMARSEAIRYVQLGWPETILIDDGSIYSQFFPQGIHEQLGIA